MTILLVRHGQTDNNLLADHGIIGNDAPLNSTGEIQTERAAELCSKFKPTQIYSSPFLRCRQTAEAIRSKTKAPICTTEFLKEFDMGDWAKLKGEETRKLLIQNKAWDHSAEKFTFRVPGGESWEDVELRVKQLLQKVTKSKNENESLVLVSHNAIIRALLGIMRNKEFRDWFGFPILNKRVYAFDCDVTKYKELATLKE